MAEHRAESPPLTHVHLHSLPFLDTPPPKSVFPGAQRLLFGGVLSSKEPPSAEPHPGGRRANTSRSIPRGSIVASKLTFAWSVRVGMLP